jgi:hypothetical protein
MIEPNNRATKNPIMPVNFRFNDIHMPTNPAVIPIGSPKFIPTPPFNMGIRDKTNTPFMANFIRDSLNRRVISIPIK